MKKGRKLKVYYLVQNLMYNCTRVVQKRWYHTLLGKPNLTIMQVYSEDKKAAEKWLKENGYQVGLGEGL